MDDCSFKDKNAIIYTTDGNIGAGKSTILEYLHTHYKLPIDLEPVKKWQPYLDDIYMTKKGIFEFQVRVWLDRCWIQPKSNTLPMLMERSPYFQRNVFIPANMENGKLNDREFITLHEMYEKSNNIWIPNGYIYLRSDPIKCSERIKIRNRQSEDHISLEYLIRLHELHEKAYEFAKANGFPIICINVDNKTVPEIAEEVWNSLTTLRNMTK